MKSIMFLILLMSPFLGSSQIVSVDVKKIQTFSHSLEFETRDAINQGKLVYGDAGYTETKYVFFLDKKIMQRKMDDYSLETYTIKEYNITSDGVYNVTVIFPYYNEKILFNFTIAPSSDGDFIRCRYLENGRIHGWFDMNAKIKRGR